MNTKPSRRELQSSRARRVFAASLLVACAALPAALATAQVATFNLVDNTNLAPTPYKIFVTGFSTAGPYVLQPDGSWATPAVTTIPTTLPCYQYPGEISKIQINGAQTAISARVYYFVVTDLTKFGQCNPPAGSIGLFGDNPNGFTYTYTVAGGMSLTTPPAADVISQAIPAWTFSEIGASSTAGTIDLSQVDFFAFPMNTQATVTAATPPNPNKIGNPIGTDNPMEVVNHATVRDSYAKYIDSLAVAQSGKTCSDPSPPSVCEYRKLLQDITTPNSPIPLYVIQNPGGYLATNTGSSLNTVFDGVIGTLWGASAPTLTLNSGGAFGGIAQDTFTSSIVTINYPSWPAGTYPVRAMRFVGSATGYIAYVINPADFQTGCQSAQIPTKYCSVPATTGYQVFAGAGALASPVDGDNFTALQAAGLLQPGAASSSDYNQLVARLGFLISGAMNRGVALATCAGQTWTCWQNETYWYPTAISATFPDITQNLFSYWMHTATIKGTPMFVRPPGAVSSASGTPSGGKPMGMAYGFSNDENPTPPATSPPQPEVPSKFDQSVAYGNTGTITFGPWLTSTTNPMLSVAISPAGGGSVTSSPPGIACDPTCSATFPAGTTVNLNATPAPGYVFTQWTGACSGSSTSCSLVVSSSASVFAQFTAIPTTTVPLTVVVSGNGSVASAPPGINCGAACSAAFATGTPVTLTATPNPGAVFAGWSGACSGTAPTCLVTMSAARNVGATYVTSSQVTLTVSAGAGGVVTTLPAGINCGSTCIAGFSLGVSVSVIATPNPGFSFTGWGGACSGTNVCDLTMDSSKSVSASFSSVAPGQFALTVIDIGNGSITSAPAGINCGFTCATSFPAGTLVTLTAIPVPGNSFAGWGGACTGLAACVVLMDDIQTVTATFVNATPIPALEIPTLSQWALLLLCGLVGIVAFARRRQRR